MLFLEYKIKFSKFTHPWSPTLAVAIVSVSIFKVHLSSVKNKVCKTTLIDRLHKQILSYDIPHPPSKLETSYKKHIINKLKQASKNLALIKKTATKLCHEHLHVRVKEVGLVGNDDLSYYIC